MVLAVARGVLLICNARPKGNDGLRIEDGVETAPGLVADHPPIVTGSAGVLGEEYVARAEFKSPIRRFEFQPAAQRDDELSGGVRVPSKFRIRVGFMEGSRGDGKFDAEGVPPDAGLELNEALFEMRL